MADREDKNPLNVKGKFYNDLSCIDCDMCREIAPNVFTRDDDEALSYVHKQPETQEDLDLAIEAMGSCPTDTIGDDGAFA